jgi:hypothetical protein
MLQQAAEIYKTERDINAGLLAEVRTRLGQAATSGDASEDEFAQRLKSVLNYATEYVNGTGSKEELDGLAYFLAAEVSWDQKEGQGDAEFAARVLQLVVQQTVEVTRSLTESNVVLAEGLGKLSNGAAPQESAEDDESSDEASTEESDDDGKSTVVLVTAPAPAPAAAPAPAPPPPPGPPPRALDGPSTGSSSNSASNDQRAKINQQSTVPQKGQARPDKLLAQVRGFKNNCKTDGVEEITVTAVPDGCKPIQSAKFKYAFRTKLGKETSKLSKSERIAFCQGNKDVDERKWAECDTGTKGPEKKGLGALLDMRRNAIADDDHDGSSSSSSEWGDDGGGGGGASDDEEEGVDDVFEPALQRVLISMLLKNRRLSAADCVRRICACDFSGCQLPCLAEQRLVRGFVGYPYYRDAVRHVVHRLYPLLQPQYR